MDHGQRASKATFTHQAFNTWDADAIGVGAFSRAMMFRLLV
jgi:hypothetical protein